MVISVSAKWYTELSDEWTLTSFPVNGNDSQERCECPVRSHPKSMTVHHHYV